MEFNKAKWNQMLHWLQLCKVEQFYMLSNTVSNISIMANKDDPCSWQSSFNEMLLFMQKESKCGHEVSLSSQYKIPPPGVLACKRISMTVRSFTSTSPPNILSPLPQVDCAAVLRHYSSIHWPIWYPLLLSAIWKLPKKIMTLCWCIFPSLSDDILV